MAVRCRAAPAPRSTLVFGGLMAAAAACGDWGPGGDHLDTLPRFVLREELRIGSAADAVAGFTRIGGVEVDEDGLVYVMETEDRHIRVYDAQGTRVRTIGRAGEGPGEFAFRGANARFGILGDTLWVRFTRFTCRGSYASDWRARIRRERAAEGGSGATRDSWSMHPASCSFW